MNLVKLLTLGQSLKEGKTVLGKYKLMQPSLLPKFVCTIRPTKTAPAAKANAAPTQEIKPVAEILAITAVPTPTLKLPTVEKELPVADVVLANKESGPLEAEKTQKILVGTVQTRSEEKKAVAAKAGFSTRIKNKISLIGKKWAPARSRKKSGAQAIQTEWALEKVKVARNDLSDADLEIVARKALAPKPKVKPTFAEVSRGKHPGQSWIKRTTRLFSRTSPFEKPAEQMPSGNVNRAEVAERI
ncbi:MAG: hypothetical protein ABIQ35_08725 [Verrucomicrobiota bacterium]